MGVICSVLIGDSTMSRDHTFLSTPQVGDEILLPGKSESYKVEKVSHFAEDPTAKRSAEIILSVKVV
jgi:hypothetical protein